MQGPDGAGCSTTEREIQLCVTGDNQYNNKTVIEELLETDSSVNVPINTREEWKHKLCKTKPLLTLLIQTLLHCDVLPSRLELTRNYTHV